MAHGHEMVVLSVKDKRRCRNASKNVAQVKPSARLEMGAGRGGACASMPGTPPPLPELPVVPDAGCHQCQVIKDRR